MAVSISINYDPVTAAKKGDYHLNGSAVLARSSRSAETQAGTMVQFDPVRYVDPDGDYERSTRQCVCVVCTYPSPPTIKQDGWK